MRHEPYRAFRIYLQIRGLNRLPWTYPVSIFYRGSMFAAVGARFLYLDSGAWGDCIRWNMNMGSRLPNVIKLTVIPFIRETAVAPSECHEYCVRLQPISYKRPIKCLTTHPHSYRRPATWPLSTNIRRMGQPVRKHLSRRA